MIKILYYVVSAIIFINFAYRGFRLLSILSRQIYAEETIHRYTCTHCEETYSLTGPEAKKHRWATRTEVRTPRRHQISYKFQCPHCEKRVRQIKIFDTNNPKEFGVFHLKMGDYKKPIIKDFLLKGVLPVIILNFLYTLFN